jgi:hypothetical protein
MDRARALAKRAKKALEQTHDYAQALDDATKAEALYHAPFHLWIIGDALVGMGRMAEAMEVFERLVSEPLAPKAPEAFRKAQEEGQRRLKELTARVPSLLLIAKGPSPSTVKATVDGKPLSLASGVATRFDAGERSIHAEAPGYAPVDQTVTLPAKGGVVVIDASFVPLPTRPVAPPRPTAERAAQEARVQKPSPAPWIGALAVGGAGLAVGGVAGGVFLSRLSALKARCPMNQCASTDEPEARTIGTIGNVSTAALVVGGVGVAAGAVIVIVQRSKAPRPSVPVTMGGAPPAQPVTMGGAPPYPPAQPVAAAFGVGIVPGGVRVGGSF